MIYRWDPNWYYRFVSEWTWEYWQWNDIPYSSDLQYKSPTIRGSLVLCTGHYFREKVSYNSVGVVKSAYFKSHRQSGESLSIKPTNNVWPRGQTAVDVVFEIKSCESVCELNELRKQTIWNYGCAFTGRLKEVTWLERVKKEDNMVFFLFFLKFELLWKTEKVKHFSRVIIFRSSFKRVSLEMMIQWVFSSLWIYEMTVGNP